MKSRLRLVVACATIMVVALTVVALDKEKSAPEAAAAKQVANPEFEKIKGLVGDWQTKAPDGQVVPTSFRLVSGGSAILISSTEPKEGDMITVVHPDSKDVIATHYCSAKNQPRLVAVPSNDPKVVKFKFKDITNLASPDAGHMKAAVFTIVDADHHTETWTWTEGGKEQVHSFEFTRVR
ncbi:MAG: hypothetical protein ACE14L_13490 [Terriglobales bacterium]